jgi:hypothetical protein
MSVTLRIWLFGKPGMELDEGSPVTPDQLRALAADMDARLRGAADAVEKLTGAGWDAQMCLYDVVLWHPYIDTAVQAEEHLHNLGLDPDRLCIDEWEDEEELDEEVGTGE